jgi:hypothetical protein
MGQASVPRKRAEQGLDAPETVRFPSPAIRPRLINSSDFDKAGGGPVQQVVEGARIWWGCGNFTGLLNEFSAAGFTACSARLPEMAT